MGWAQIALAEDPYSALAWVTSASQWLAEIFTLSAGLNWTHRRVVSRLEKATTRLHRDDILQDYGKLMGFPRTLERAGELLSDLQLGYREVWSYFKGKNGPVYMVQQPDSEAWFKNRIVCRILQRNGRRSCCEQRIFERRRIRCADVESELQERHEDVMREP